MLDDLGGCARRHMIDRGLDEPADTVGLALGVVGELAAVVGQTLVDGFDGVRFDPGAEVPGR